MPSSIPSRIRLNQLWSFDVHLRSLMTSWSTANYCKLVLQSEQRNQKWSICVINSRQTRPRTNEHTIYVYIHTTICYLTSRRLWWRDTLFSMSFKFGAIVDGTSMHLFFTVWNALGMRTVGRVNWTVLKPNRGCTFESMDEGKHHLQMSYRRHS